MIDIEAILSNKEMWEAQAKESAELKDRLRSFGPHAFGVLVQTERGLFVVDPEDITVSRELLTHGIFNREEFNVASSFVTKGSNVLVIGAHIGTHAIGLAKECKHVTAIEANPHTYQLLEANVSLSKASNITLHQCAAAEEEKTVEFLLNRANSGGSKRGPLKHEKIAYVYDKPEKIQVKAKPLDGLIEPKNFDLIIMDIEGSEYFALQGMPQILARTKALSMEYLPHHMDNVSGASPKDIADLLLPHFDWLYMPGSEEIVPKHAIANYLQQIYDANYGFENIYFLKDPLPERLVPKG